MRRLQYYFSDKIICLSPALRQVCIDSKINLSKIELIPRSVSTVKFRPNKNLNSIIPSTINKESHKVILFVGSFRYDKYILIDIFKIYTKSDNSPKKLNLLFCENLSDSETLFYLNKLDKFYKKNKIRDKIIFFENVSNVNEFMQVSDLLVFPSRREGLPNVVLESMSSGLPVIASRLPGIIDYIIDNEQNGIIIHKPKAEIFFKKIQNIFSDDDQYEKLSKQCRIKIKILFE